MINTVVDEVISDNIIYEDYGNTFLDDFVGSWPREASRGIIQFSDGDIWFSLKNGSVNTSYLEVVRKMTRFQSRLLYVKPLRKLAIW